MVTQQGESWVGKADDN